MPIYRKKHFIHYVKKFSPAIALVLVLCLLMDRESYLLEKSYITLVGS